MFDALTCGIGVPFSAGSKAFRFLLGGSVAMFLVTNCAAQQTGNSAERPFNAAATCWSFQPLRSSNPPAVENTKWPRTAIDEFVLSKLEEGGLQPAAPASKQTLLRRATFDLIGLPPTPEEMDAFLADTSPNAFERVVERLLSSPHYGERWGRHWLDVARYADNKGYVFFEEKSYPWAWAYRDYVVRAFNEDKPFDRFVLEQLVADQIDLNGDSRALAALGFLTVGDHFSNNTHDILDDRIDVVSRGLLGLTVGCARCHDHKFDPISQADYYALYGVFRSCTEPMVPPAVEEPALKESYENFELELMQRERNLRQYVQTKHREIVHGARGRIGEYLMAVYAQRSQPVTENFMFIADKGDLNPTVIARWRTYLERVGQTNAVWAPWHEFAQLSVTNFAQLAPGVLSSVRKSAQLNQQVAAAFSEAPKSMTNVAERYATLLTSIDKRWHESLSDAVRNATPAPRQLPDSADEELRQVLYGPDSPCNIPEQMDWGFLSLLPDRASQGEFQNLLKDLEQWLMHGPEAPARAMVLADLPVAYEARIFQRGNPNRLGASVPRRFLQLLNPSCRPFTRGSGRLELAQAIVDANNPLTARVFVNRVWLHHFGAGLVTTPSDFGMRSEPPSHPELLDWLAREFIRGGWKVKNLHRLIMNSAVYQQASFVVGCESARDLDSNGALQPKNAASLPDVATRDPENRLLARMNRRRHDFETQRDALLAVAGTLDRKSGGPPVELSTPRRTLYTLVNRMDVPPVMTTFDFPSPSTSCPRREQTTVAPQALYLMNNNFAADCAQAILRRSDIASLNSMSAKVNRLHELLFSRAATSSDLRRAESTLARHQTKKSGSTTPTPCSWRTSLCS